ncbi:MAG: DNA-formamidopyrimidine glycosylase [Desulfobulbus propionicus]|nr:MAG: DNA-formamidopyrimidine glycosylase [Desulfobulbus propionicus]
MPELPEVEVTRQGLLPHLPGRVVQALWWSGKKLRTEIPQLLLREEIQGQTVTAIDRRAKYLLFRMSNNAVLVIHLGMTGKLSVLNKKMPKEQHDHLALTLDNDQELRLHDTRRFGNVLVWPKATAAEDERHFSEKAGIEPLGAHFTASNLFALASNTKLTIKQFLMDGKRVSGVGNIYANEGLFKSGIHPATPAGKITKKQWQCLVNNIRKVLQDSIKSGGTTISDFISSSGQPGYFQLQLDVYGKNDEPCPNCNDQIVKIELGQRATFFCPTCQPKSRCRNKQT